MMHDNPLPTEGVELVAVVSVFWLRVILLCPSQSHDQWFCRVVSVTAAGAAEDSHLLPDESSSYTATEIVCYIVSNNFL